MGKSTPCCEYCTRCLEITKKNSPNQSIDPSSPGSKVQFNKALLYISMYSAVFLAIGMNTYIPHTKGLCEFCKLTKALL